MSSPPTKLDTLTLDIQGVAVLLFGDERLEEVTPVSKHGGDTAKVYVRPLSLGQIIAQADPQENYFHVELVTDHSHPHAEIWYSFEWKISNAREQRFRATEKARTQDYTTKNIRVSEIVSTIQASNGPLASAPEAFLKELAATIVTNYNKKDLSGIYQAIDLAELLNRYAQEDQSSQRS